MSEAGAIARELTFLTEYTNEDEATLLARALRLGLKMLHREIVEQALIDDRISPQTAEEVLGRDRVEEILYAKKALAEDVVRGLQL